MGVSKIKFLAHAMVAILPSFLKRPCYRMLFGYKVGENVRVGFSIIYADKCLLEDNVSIGHLNLFIGTKDLRIGEHSKIGHINILRGGDVVDIGRYTEIIRLNEINAIPDPIAVNEVDSRFILGDGSIVTTSHKIDFTDKVEIGKRAILGGRNSSLWTHNRQETKQITIGDYSYIGSEIRIAPGGEIPASSIVGIGSVITKKIEGEYNLIGGVPAKIIKPLDDEGKKLTRYKTRPDLPDEIE